MEAQRLCAGELSQRQRQQHLDGAYAHFLSELERQVCERTATPLRMRSRRGRPPRIRWVEQSTRCGEHRASWCTMVRPLQWVHSWVQDVLGYLDGSSPDATSSTLLQDLEECLSEFRPIPSFIGLHQRA